MPSRLHPSLIVIACIGCFSFGALATAWTAQYGFDLFPCELCLYQRLPYIALVCLAFLSIMPLVDSEARQLATYVSALLFFAVACTAFFHVGVEQEWWQTKCAPVAGRSISFDDMRSALLKPGRPACNEIQFSLFGLSMAGYNVIAGLISATASLWAARNTKFWH